MFTSTAVVKDDAAQILFLPKNTSDKKGLLSGNSLASLLHVEVYFLWSGPLNNITTTLQDACFWWNPRWCF